LFNFDEIKQFTNCVKSSNGFNLVKNSLIKQKVLVDIFSSFNFFFSFWIHFWEKHDLWSAFELFSLFPINLVSMTTSIFMKMYSNVI